MRLARRSLGIAAALLPGLAAAQEFPARPVRMVIGFPPGGGVDIVARLIAPRLHQTGRRPRCPIGRARAPKQARADRVPFLAAEPCGGGRAVAPQAEIVQVEAGARQRRGIAG